MEHSSRRKKEVLNWRDLGFTVSGWVWALYALNPKRRTWELSVWGDPQPVQLDGFGVRLGPHFNIYRFRLKGVANLKAKTRFEVSRVFGCRDQWGLMAHRDTKNSLASLICAVNPSMAFLEFFEAVTSTFVSTRYCLIAFKSQCPGPP